MSSRIPLGFLHTEKNQIWLIKVYQLLSTHVNTLEFSRFVAYSNTFEYILYFLLSLFLIKVVLTQASISVFLWE